MESGVRAVRRTSAPPSATWRGVRRCWTDASAALGLSMGGERISAAAVDGGGSRAVVSEGAEVITVADAAARPETVGGWPSIPMLWVEAITEDLPSDASPPAPLSESIAAIAPRPVLLIASGDVTEAASNRFYAEAGGPTVRAVGDGDAPTSARSGRTRDEYERRVVALFDAALLG